MKITTEQRENIREVLWSNLKYLETFNELYDHIITAIEHTEEGEFKPHELADNIIKQDLGGWDAIKELEKQRHRAIADRLWGKLWQQVAVYFKLPLILFTVLMACGAYLMVDQVSRTSVYLVLFITAMIPMGLWVRLAPFNRFSKRYKQSIKESAAERMGGLAVSVLNCVMFIPPFVVGKDGYKVLEHANAVVVTLVVIVFMVYTLSAIKIFREDLKPGLVS